MDACMQWPSGGRDTAPGAAALDPSALPRAGKTVPRDSLHTEYREAAVLSSEPHPLRATCNWFAPPTGSGRDRSPVELPRMPHSTPPRKPSYYDNKDISRSWPASHGYTFVTQQSLPFGSAHTRCVNPLVPEYPLPSGAQRIFPTEPTDSGTIEGHAFERRRHRDWSFERGAVPRGDQNADIEGSCPRPPSWQSRPAREVLNYQDVARSTSEQCRRHVARQRDGRPPVDTGPLGMWADFPDIRMQRSKRRGHNPVKPAYRIHGRDVTFPVGIGEARKLKQLTVDPGRRTWAAKEGSEWQTLANDMLAMSAPKQSRNFFPRKQGVLDLYQEYRGRRDPKIVASMLAHQAKTH